MKDLLVNSKRWLSLKDFPNEEWKDIDGFKGLYQVSSYGRIKSLERVVERCRKGKTLQFHKNAQILKQGLSRGYLRVYFSLFNGKTQEKTTFLVHRLVASAFIPNKEMLLEINHKNEVKTDNKVENLEWCTSYYNVNYGTRTERARKSNSKIIRQYDLDGNFIKEYESSVVAAKILGVDSVSIRNVCNGKTNSAYGYQWRYKIKENRDKISSIVIRYYGAVAQYTKEGVFVKAYNTIKEAEKETHIDGSSISIACRGKKIVSAGGYQWRCVDLEKDNYTTQIEPLPILTKVVCRKSLAGEVIREFKSVNEASMSIGVKPQKIYNAIRRKEIVENSLWCYC